MSLLTQDKQPVIVIPAYQPSLDLITLVQTLVSLDPLQSIIVVNDGSTGENQAIFTKLSQLNNVVVLHHAINLGKGQALKTAFNYYLLHFSSHSVGVVTADADGQHSAKDILKLVEHLKNSPQMLWLGSRTLNKHVPLRSRFGNALTSKIFQLLMQHTIHDTQTGLRGIPRAMIADLLRIPSSRYEYELDMLIRSIHNNIKIAEIPIETIYINNNQSSHFNPILDSVKVYFVFLRYLVASISSACIDFFSFVILHLLSNEIFFSLGMARTLSGTFNFVVCRKIIFKSGENIVFSAFKYLTLLIFSFSFSYILILGLVKDYKINLYLSKIIADICVFLINFSMQKVFVFPLAATKE